MNYVNGHITIGYLWSIVDYVPATGQFFWRDRPKIPSRAKRRFMAKQPIGKIAANGYLYITIDGKSYLAARLAYFYMTGLWPPSVDHKNRNKTDNRWKNIRAANKPMNAGNTKLYNTSTSGIKGVSFSKEKRKWRAHITMNYKTKHLGYFTSKKKARDAYKDAARKYFGEFAKP